jgi:flavin-dependent dehydrogenase
VGITTESATGMLPADGVTDLPRYDVLVVGGGPGGSTIAALLASRGEHVALVDKDRHPRFHIGESLLPLNVDLFDKLGVKDEIEKIGMPKFGVEFVSPYHNKAVTLDFARAWDKRFFYSYQVRRSEFDHILLKNAAAKGAVVTEGCRIEEVTFLPDGGVVASGRDDAGQAHRFHAKFLVDASGRDTLLAKKLGTREANRRHNSAAVYGHFTGARRLPGKLAGNITIFWFDHGWFWFIPLADGTTSVGAVCPPDFFKTRKGDLTEFFHSVIAMCPEIADRLKEATMTGPATATGNYSYKSQRMVGQNYIMVGDAFAFVDPVFSTGVYIAMKSAFMGADVVTSCLHQPAQSARALKRFDREVRLALTRFSWYIYRITRPAMRDLFMSHGERFRITAAVLALLSGDAFGPSPIRSRLMLFKGIYYGMTAWNAVQRRLAPGGQQRFTDKKAA